MNLLLVQSYKKVTKTKLLIITSNKICKRSYPGKALIKTIGSNPSKNLLEMLKTFEGKKYFVLTYMDLLKKIHFYKNITIENNTMIIRNKENMDDYCVVSKQISKNFFINDKYKEITKSSIKNQIEPTNLQNIKPLAKNLCAFFLDKNIPASNWVKLLILERIDPNLISIGFTRGFVFDLYLNHLIYETANPYVLNKFIIHMGMGKAGIDFMSELLVAYNHYKDIEKMQSIKILEYHMLAKNKPGSDNAIKSLKYTGQQDCDVQLILQRLDNNTNIILYLDIKQKELDIVNDRKFLYIKIAYSVNGKNSVGIIENPTYVAEYLNMCIERLEMFESNEKVIRFLEKFYKIEKLDDRLLHLHEFILLNADKHPEIQMAVMSKVDIEPQINQYVEVAEKYASRVPDDVLINPKAFNKASAEIYQQFVKTHIENPLEVLRIESFRKHLLSDKAFKPIFMTNKNYLDLSDSES